jgi:hypothetical protein
MNAVEQPRVEEISLGDDVMINLWNEVCRMTPKETFESATALWQKTWMSLPPQKGNYPGPPGLVGWPSDGMPLDQKEMYTLSTINTLEQVLKMRREVQAFT